jgi:transposase-like protein
MSGHPKRRGQRYIPTVVRLQALDLHREGVSPRDIAARLDVNRGTVRCWLSRARHRPPTSEAELERLAAEVEAGIFTVNRRLAERDPRALLAAARALTGAVDKLLEVGDL